MSELKTLKENLMRIRCEKCGEVFYLDKKIWAFHRGEKAFCKFCGAEGIMKELFKIVFVEEENKNE